MGMFDFMKGKPKDMPPPMDIPDFDMPMPNEPQMYPQQPVNTSSEQMNNIQKSQLTPAPFSPQSLAPMTAPQQLPIGPPPGPPSPLPLSNPPVGKPLPPLPEAPMPPPLEPAPFPEPATTMPEPPAPPTQEHTALLTEDVERLVESTINQKWEKINAEVAKLESWQKQVDTKVTKLAVDVKSLDGKLSETQKAILSKVNDYNSSLKDVNTEMKAMSKVFDKVLPSFTSSIRELRGIVGKSKRSRPAKITKTRTTTAKRRGRPRKKR